MQHCIIFVILSFLEFCNSFWPASYKVDFRDEKTFVISAGKDVDDEDDDESENEMIQPEDLVDIAPLVNDEDRYKPLHSHVEHYNRRAADAALQTAESVPYLEKNMEEMNSFDEGKPFIAGFKHQLDEYNFDQVESTTIYSQKEVASSVSHSGVTPYKIIKRSLEKYSESSGIVPFTNRSKRNEDEDILGLTEKNAGGDLVETLSSRNHSLPQDSHGGHATPHPADSYRQKEPEFPKIESESQHPEEYDVESTGISLERLTPTEAAEEANKANTRRLESEEMTTQPEIIEMEEAYDYENFRAEYDRQLEEAKSSNLTFNYTDNGEPENTAKDAMKKIVEFDMPKNCTKEELTQFGVKALECLAFDYQHSKNKADVRKVLARTWTVVRIWLCIYVCIAVPCWFQKGWCCCCFRCSVCFPHEVIYAAKHYYAHNPPGVLVDQLQKEKTEEALPVKYKPTLFELDAYEDLESAIRNL